MVIGRTSPSIVAKLFYQLADRGALKWKTAFPLIIDEYADHRVHNMTFSGCSSHGSEGLRFLGLVSLVRKSRYGWNLKRNQSMSIAEIAS